MVALRFHRFDTLMTALRSSVSSSLNIRELISFGNLHNGSLLAFRSSSSCIRFFASLLGLEDRDPPGVLGLAVCLDLEVACVGVAGRVCTGV